MDWKSEAVAKLRLYEAKRAAVRDLPDDIAQLESEKTKLGGATSSSVPVKGGGSRQEDRLLNILVRQGELKVSLEQAQKWLDRVDNALAVLNSEERLILERLFINREMGAVDRLAGDLHLDPKTVYKRKDAALHRFATAMYGNVET